jgi:hypothetical protein
MKNGLHPFSVNVVGSDGMAFVHSPTSRGTDLCYNSLYNGMRDGNVILKAKLWKKLRKASVTHYITIR